MNGDLLTGWFKVFFTLLFSPFLLYSQNHIMKFEHLTVDDGLSGSVIECIMRDSRGFMWFGTRNGLNRYDGYKFTIYRNDVNNPHSISHNWINGGIIEDSKGNLWIGTWGGGLNRFDRYKETFFQYKHDNKNPNSICNNFIERIHEDKSGNLWICTVGGLSKVVDHENLDSNDAIQFVNYKHNPEGPYSLSDDHIFSAYEDNEGVLWIGTASGGINLLNRGSERFINKNNLSTERSHFIRNPLLGGEINWFQEYSSDGDSLITIGTNNVIYKLNKKNDKITNVSKTLSRSLNIPDRDIGNYIEDKNGQAWIFPRIQSGLYITNKTKDIAFDLYSDPHDPFSVSSNYVQSWYEDKDGIIWIGTLGGGINKYIKEKDIFEVTTLTISTSVCSITSIHEDISENGPTLWIGTEGHGLLRYDMGTKDIKQYKLEYPIRAICQTKSDPDNIWIGTLRGGLLKFSRNNKTFSNQHVYESKEDLKQFNFTVFILSITSDEKGILWIGSGGGLIRFDPDTKEFKHYFSDVNNEYSLSDNEINSLCFSNYKNEPVLWVGTRHGGLNRFDPDKETFYHFKNSPDDSSSIASDYISSIYEDHSGNLWIGTAGGLQNFDRIQNKFLRYIDKDRLLNIDIMGILEGKDGILWLHTKSGICRFDPQNRNLRFFDKDDGLPGKDFYRYAYYENTRGDLYFGGNNKILVFNPANIRKNTNMPPIVITDFQIFNKSVKPGNDSPLSKSISNTDEIILPSDQSVFSFEFAALDYTTPNKNKYAYKMEGIDPDWVYTDASRRYATYTHLDPGKYVFKVKGSNSDGVWNEEGASVKIVILPPWWKTWWAYTVYACLLFGLIYFLRRYELNRQNLKHSWELERVETEKYQEIDRMKSRFFANISHEFRTPLTLIKGPVQQMLSGDFIGNVERQYKVILRNTNRLMQLINQLLDLSKLESGQMTLRTSLVDVVPLLKGLTHSFESLARQKNITLQFQSCENNIIVYIDRDKFEKIIINLLSNAFKFTPDGGSISVSINPSQPPLTTGSGEEPPDKGELRAVEITVKNTGLGIPPDQLHRIFDRFYQIDDSSVRKQEGTGIGLALTKELVELHHGKIKVKSEPGEGTTFTIHLPLGKEHLSPEEIVVQPTETSMETQIDSLETEPLPSSASKVETTSKKRKKDYPTLLIVEDNPDMRDYIRGCLESNYEIRETDDGEKGIQRALKYPPELIISDVMMPRMDGFEFCAKIKTDERTSHIPVILLTAKASGESKIEGLETGADDYLTKPFDTRELRARVKNLIEQRRQLQKKFQRGVRVEPSEVTVTSIDEKLLQRAINAVENNISSPNFDTAALAKEIGMSRMLLHTKIKALTGQSTGEFIRTLRLKRAAQLLQKGYGNVTEVAYDVGFQSLSYFAKVFREQFGQSPSHYSARSKANPR